MADNEFDRRIFLKGIVAAALLSGCSGASLHLLDEDYDFKFSDTDIKKLTIGIHNIGNGRGNNDYFWRHFGEKTVKRNRLLLEM